MSGPGFNAPLLAVTGSQRPYIFDLPHLISLPTGFEFRFRYRHRWVEKALVQSILTNDDDLVGREIVILFHSRDSKRIIPIRRGIILGVESIGPMIFLKFRVGEFVKVYLDIVSNSDPKSGTMETAVNKLSTLAGELLGRIETMGPVPDLSKPLPHGCYLRWAQKPLLTEEWDDGKPAAAWAKIAAVLQGEPSLRGIPLFYLVGFRTEAGAEVNSAAVKNRFSLTRREEIHGFSLVESERYRMRVLVWWEPSLGIDQLPVRVNCEFNAALLALEGSSNVVVGEYDMIEFTFSALRSGYSELALRAEPLDKARESKATATTQVEAHPSHGATAWAEWPAIFVARVPIVVKLGARKLLWSTVSLIVGLGLYWLVAPTIDEPWKRVFELGSLSIFFFGGGPIVERLKPFFKFSESMDKLRGGPNEGGKTSNE